VSSVHVKVMQKIQCYWKSVVQGRNEGGTITRAPKSPNNVTSTVLSSIK